MRRETIDARTKRVLESLGETDFIKDFYLAGGTAMALQIGHRKSIDLDWFSKKEFSNMELKYVLSGLGLGRLKIYSEDEKTLNVDLHGVKTSFFEYKYRTLFPFEKYGKNVNLASMADIACMKIDAISSRGSKKDFIDLYFMLQKYSLKELLDFFDKKYKEIEYNHLHILKSLIYFQDAENDPMPLMLKKIDWEGIKKKIKRQVREYMG